MPTLSISRLPSVLSSYALVPLAIAALLIRVAGPSGELLELIRRRNQEEEYSRGCLIGFI